MAVHLKYVLVTDVDGAGQVIPHSEFYGCVVSGAMDTDLTLFASFGDLVDATEPASLLNTLRRSFPDFVDEVTRDGGLELMGRWVAVTRTDKTA